MNFLGIDPGKTGGICCLDSKESGAYLYLIPKINNVVDLRALGEIFDNFPVENTIITMEKIHALGQVSAKSTFEFGRIYGMLEGIFASKGFKYTLTTPKIWQKEMFEGVDEIRKPSNINKNGKTVKGRVDTKKMAAIACNRLFPDVDLNITEKGNKSKNVHDGLADALLIAEYTKRKYGKGETK